MNGPQGNSQRLCPVNKPQLDLVWPNQTRLLHKQANIAFKICRIKTSAILQICFRRLGKCFTCVTKTIANLTTYSRKPGDYNGTIIFEIDIMKNSSPLNLIFTFFAMSKPKQHFFSAGLTALSAQFRVNQNKINNQTTSEKVKFDKDLN